MITKDYPHFIFKNFSAFYYLLILMTYILTGWLFQLTHQRLRTNDSLPLRSHFFISITKYLNNRRKIEIILCVFIILFMINVYFANYLQNTLLRLLALTFVVVGSVKIVTIFKAEKQVYQELQHLDKRKSNFLADIAHKFKIPLTIVRLNNDMAKSSLKDQDYQEAEESIDRSIQAVGRLTRMSTNLVTLGKIDFGLSKLEKHRFDLSQLISSSLADFEPLLGSRKLVSNIEPNIEICGDSSRIQEMLFNLLDNAVKFTDPELDKIEVNLETVDERRRLRSSYRNSSVEDQPKPNDQNAKRNERRDPNRQTIVLTISDDGIGIDEAVLPNLFSRYYQVESRSGSAGIGLAICKWIVEGHNGTIEIESEKGEGTRIIIRFQVD